MFSNQIPAYAGFADLQVCTSTSIQLIFSTSVFRRNFLIKETIMDLFLLNRNQDRLMRAQSNIEIFSTFNKDQMKEALSIIDKDCPQISLTTSQFLRYELLNSEIRNASIGNGNNGNVKDIVKSMITYDQTDSDDLVKHLVINALSMNNYGQALDYLKSSMPSVTSEYNGTIKEMIEITWLMKDVQSARSRVMDAIRKTEIDHTIKVQ